MGALVMRGLMIWLGVALVDRFHWILYIFGAFLLITGIRMLVSKGEEIDLESNFVLRMCRRWMRVTPDYHGQKFIVKDAGVWMLTPLALVLIVIDIMDLVFAVDSIPAVFAITQDEFIIYTSNICAILGLRSLYFVLAHIIDRFIYLKTGLAIVLGFVGVKMLIAEILSRAQLGLARLHHDRAGRDHLPFHARDPPAARAAADRRRQKSSCLAAKVR